MKRGSWGARGSAMLVALLFAAACGSDSGGIPVVSDADSGNDESIVDPVDPVEDVQDPEEPAPTSRSGSGIEIRDTVSVGTVDPRLLGTNVPAWLGEERLAEPHLWDAMERSGATLLRLPGGSWSNYYRWLACETESDACSWPWAMAPRDFLQLVDQSGLDAMWTAAFNGSAEEAAALVAFFNASVGDGHEIGTDRFGTDWGTVGEWAQMRADLGFPEPVRVEYWEVGNEIYGAVAEAGEGCAEWGWEKVSTCDGTEYMLGTDDQDGFFDFAAAMRAVDSTIQIGAVGTADPAGWGGFGVDVLSAGGAAIDFYVVHDYGFGGEPVLAEALDRPDGRWEAIANRVATVATALEVEVPPVAVTEYNLAAWRDADVEALMTRMVNLFYITETIGEMAVAGVDMATQWNLMNGVGENGTDYGLVHPDSGVVYPQFFSLMLWSTMGTDLVGVKLDSAVNDLEAWATASPAGYDLLVLNPTDVEYSTPLILSSDESFDLTADQVVAESLTSTAVLYNGALGGVVGDLPVGAVDLGQFASGDEITIPAFSATVFHLRRAG